jgi:predicted metal-dependent TIM-barrel fold hydrolase
LNTYTIQVDGDVLCLGDVQDLLVAAISHHCTGEYGPLPAGVDVTVDYAHKAVLIEDRRAPLPRIEHRSAVALRKTGLTNDEIRIIAAQLEAARR